MLAYQWHKQNGLAVVFLHGLLGSQQDWAEVIRLLQQYPEIRPLTLDLCFHGNSHNMACNNFAQQRAYIDQTLTQLLGNMPFWLVGYSLGGRTALDYTLHIQNPHQQGTILEGTNIGLTDEQEKQSRWQDDCHWAARFTNEPIASVLYDWYQQPVFADLTPNKRSDLIEKRRHNSGRAIAKMLRATSLAKQPHFLPSIQRLLEQKNHRLSFFVGEKDQKFLHLTQQYQLPYHLILQAGHNAHRDNPQCFTEKLIQIIRGEI